MKKLIDTIVLDIENQIYNDLDSVIEKLDYYRELSQKGLSNLNNDQYNELHKNIKDFFNVQFLAISHIYNSELYRVTFNKGVTDGKNTKITNISQLLGPPTEKAKMNRCNLEGESVFYSAIDLNTAIWETKPQPGDIITISEWKIKPDKYLIANSIFNHPEIDEINMHSKKMQERFAKEIENVPPTQNQLFNEIIKFATEEFVKIVDREKPKEYLFSAYFSSEFSKTSPDGYRTEAIVYPSIQRNYRTSNIAILNSVVLDKLDLLGITTYKVITANYDKKPNLDESPIGVFPAFIRTEKFDVERDLVIYTNQK